MRHKTFSPRSAVLTLYGDYALNRNGQIGIGSLVELFANFGLSGNAVRSAVARMCRSGLLKSRRVNGRSYYHLTGDGRSLLSDGAQRIFERKGPAWDGMWSVVMYSIPERRRGARDRLRTELGWLGYGPLSEATWICPHDRTKEVTALAEKLKVTDCVQVFQSRHVGLTDPAAIVRRCWELPRIHRRYSDFLGAYRPKLEAHKRRLAAGEEIAPDECFAARFELTHEYRKLPFHDPDLPLELLPASWLRPDAAAVFNEYHNLLADKANRYYDAVAANYEARGRAGRGTAAALVDKIRHGVMTASQLGGAGEIR